MQVTLLTVMHNEAQWNFAAFHHFARMSLMIMEPNCLHCFGAFDEIKHHQMK
jgi:hypothetical protein